MRVNRFISPLITAVIDYRIRRVITGSGKLLCAEVTVGTYVCKVVGILDIK